MSTLFFKFGLAAVSAFGTSGVELQPAGMRSQEIVRHEVSFAEKVGREGYRQGFLHYIADEGILFMPKPIPGKPMLTSMENFDANLSWTPAFAGISTSDDLGFTTGPYVLDMKGKRNTGQYVTVWQRQPDGSWRFVLDQGIEGPSYPSMAVASIVELPIGLPRAKTSKRQTTDGVMMREAAYEKASRQRNGRDLAKFHSPSSRIIRMGRAPATTTAERGDLFRTSAPIDRFDVSGCHISAAGDLAYTYGTASWIDHGERRSDAFVRIWSREGDTWKIVLDSRSRMSRH